MIKIGYIKEGLILLYFLFVTGCFSRETSLYEGKVVDEQGIPIQNVTVELCYQDWRWDWSQWRLPDEFPLTIDTSVCSDPVTTDEFGNYRVHFSGPPSTFVLARHKDWIQLKSFPAKDGRIVMVNRKIRQQRLARQAEEEERRFRQHKPGETDIEYYCRVVRKRASTIELIYHSTNVTVAQALLAGYGKVTFAMAGPHDAVYSFADEFIVGSSVANRTGPVLDKFNVYPVKENCGKMTHLIQSEYYGPDAPSFLHGKESVNVSVPSIRVGFTMKIWDLN